MIYVTKQVKFSAAHRLFNPTYSDVQNDSIYDKCNNYHGHGHNYILEVTVKGVPDINTGYLIDLKKLKAILFNEIVSKVDHKHLNFDVEFLEGIIPTVENLAVTFWKILETKIPNAKLHCIKIYESDTSYVEYFGEAIEVQKFEVTK